MLKTADGVREFFYSEQAKSMPKAVRSTRMRCPFWASSEVKTTAETFVSQVGRVKINDFSFAL